MLPWRCVRDDNAGDEAFSPFRERESAIKQPDLWRAVSSRPTRSERERREGDRGRDWREREKERVRGELVYCS